MCVYRHKNLKNILINSIIYVHAYICIYIFIFICMPNSITKFFHIYIVFMLSKLTKEFEKKNEN